VIDVSGQAAHPVDDSRVAAVKTALNTIIDPCSAASATRVGLVDMGIIDRVEVEGDDVRVALLPTFAGCLFVGMFRADIEERVLTLDWAASVDVEMVHAPTYWDESRMSDDARRRLGERREALRRELAVLNKSHPRPARP
jgi:ring-1,2-phenylacetyl-CoA epoxidase subunit PaaD